jgi:hypothetical protein
MAKAIAKKSVVKKSATKKSVSKSTGRAQDRGKVAGAQDYEVAYAAEKNHRSAKAVKKAVKKVGNARKKVNKEVRKPVK